MSRKNQKREEELLDELLAKYGATEEGIFGKEGIVRDLTRRLVERALSGELTHHLGYAKGEAPEEVDNHRNGYSAKRLKVGDGEMEIAVPRDREGSFEPVLVRKGQRRFAEFDQRIIAMYGRGMTVREIQGFLEEQYGVEVSAEFISTVTDSVLEEVREWQNRPLESVYAVVLFDALRVRIRDEGTVKNKAVYLALGTRVDGKKEVLGMWIEQNEGAKFWLKVMNELKNRGVSDLLIAVVDGLKGFPEAIRAVYPQSQVQTCIVHLVRYGLSFCSWKERKAVAAELKKIYRAENAQAAWQRLEEFEQSELGRKYQMIGQSWRRAWEEVIPFLSYPQEIRRSIYTTNAIESLHMQLRKVMKNRGHFPSDEAASKLMYLGLRNIMTRWQATRPGWSQTALQFAILFGERFTANRPDGGYAPPNPAPLAAAGVRGEQGSGAAAPCPKSKL
jgi:putative transposase